MPGLVSGAGAPGLPAKDACPAHRRGAEVGPILSRFVSRSGKRRQAALSPPMRRRSVGTTERESDRTFENAPNALPASDTQRGPDFNLCDKSGPDAVLSGFRKRMRRYSGPETEGSGDRVRRLSRRTARLAVGDLLPSFASILFCCRFLAAVRRRPLRGRCPSPPIAEEGRAADGRLFSRVGVGADGRERATDTPKAVVRSPSRACRFSFLCFMEKRGAACGGAVPLAERRRRKQRL